MSQDLINNALKRLAIDKSYSAYLAMSNALDKTKAEDSGWPLYKIAMLRNYTIDPLLPVIKGELAKLGLYPKVYLGEFDNIAQDVLDPQSALYVFAPDIIFINQWLEELPAQDLDRVIKDMQKFISAIRQQVQVPVIVNNFLLPTSNEPAEVMRRLNQQLKETASAYAGVHILDVMALGQRLGFSEVFDQRYWQIGRAPIGKNALVPLGMEYGKLVRALTGKARKCLVLDCDNVLWDGIVGEEGIKAINFDFQRNLLALHDRGIILALNSKNNEADVLDILEKHPDMILRPHHFATWQINWEDKANNLMRIAQTLNIGLDSMVFADDSAFECDFIRQQLPQVEVVCLNGDPSTFKDKIIHPGYFDSLIVTQEDKNRNQMYQDEIKRKDKMAQASTLEDYLTGLAIEAEIGIGDDTTLERIAQLTQKTNQFNLTTRRYTTADIASFINDEHVDVLYLKLKDNISDMGLVGVAIIKYNGKEAVIDTLLLSCRVLGRGVETAFLANIVSAVKSRGCLRLRGEYIATAKNTQVAQFYGRNGFIADVLTLENASMPKPTWIKVINKRSTYAGS